MRDRNTSENTQIDPIWRQFRIFDAHAHIGEYYDIDARLTDDQLVSHMKEYNITRCAVSAVTKNIPGDNDLVAEAIKKFPDRIVGLAHVDPSAGAKALTEMDRCLRIGFKGLKLHPHYDAYMVYDSKLVFPVLERAAKNRLPILIHTGTPPMTTPIHVGYLAQHFPDVNFICGHMGLADCTFEAAEAGEMAENVYMDITGAAVPSMIERAINRLGAERFLWGTDVPYDNFIGQFFNLLSLRIPEEDKRRILWDNPVRIYRL